MPGNADVAAIFRSTAALLEIKGENIFRVRAYEKAARNIESLPEDINLLAKTGRLREIPGIGADLEAKIQEIVSTGELSFFSDLKESLPPGLPQLLEIPSLGPKTVSLLYKQANINSLSDLEAAISSGRLLTIPGIKEKSLENMSKGIRLFKSSKERMPLRDAESLAQEIQENFPPGSLSVAGSLRRRVESVGDIDFLSSAGEGNVSFINNFIAAVGDAELLARGGTKVSLRASRGTQIDLRLVKKEEYGAALVYFTGSRAFNVKLRHIAGQNGYKLNEYGLYDAAGSRIAGKTEQEIFSRLKMSFVPPELREDRGEIELALEKRLPPLVEQSMIRGDLHTHSRWSDGEADIEEMAEAAKALGYSYIAITDHSQSLKIAGGLSPRRLSEKRREIAAVNARHKGKIRVLYGTETEIGPGGELDYDDAVLAEFDIVLGAVHTGFSQSEKQLTARIVKACKNRWVHIIAHPTGRLRGVREPYKIDLKTVFKAAADTNTGMEINSYHQRMDLNDVNCRMAADNGVRLAVNTDSHHPDQLKNIRYGVDIARRGRLGPQNVINTLGVEGLLKTIKKK
ncbi:MAG: DNA polymerase/3'-5' exonuclease PolX [Elusimicrobia bacterium]|nr:DNA polymerase/3'-5' exonuclease PolX [Elusimicrobiota bacterium]